MKVGGRRIIIMPAALGYGASPPEGSNIPANSPLVFVVDLKKIEATPASSPQPADRGNVQEDHRSQLIFLHQEPLGAVSAGRSTTVRDLPAPTAQHGNIRRKITSLRDEHSRVPGRRPQKQNHERDEHSREPGRRPQKQNHERDERLREESLLSPGGDALVG